MARKLTDQQKQLGRLVRMSDAELHALIDDARSAQIILHSRKPAAARKPGRPRKAKAAGKAEYEPPTEMV